METVHGDSSWRQFMETLDHSSDLSKLWRTIKAIDGKSSPKGENDVIAFDDTQVSSPKQIANYFNRPFSTSMLRRHTSSRETRLMSREIKRQSLMSVVTFTAVPYHSPYITPHSNPSYPGPTQNKQMSPTMLILKKIDADKHPSPLCPLHKSEPHTTTHLFNCTNINTQLKVTDLWTAPVEMGHLLVE